MFRSRKLLDHARDQRCMNCGSTHGVVAAHSNQHEHGKGAGMKAHDCFHAWLCHSCHSWLDQGGNDRDPTGRYDPSYHDKAEMFTRAMHKTWLQLFEQQLLTVASR